MNKGSLKVKLILIILFVILGGFIIFLLLRKNFKEINQKEPTVRPLEGQTGRFTPLIKQYLENSGEKNKEQPLENEENSGSQIGSLAPDFTLKNLNDQTITLNDFKGKNILLVFWALSCGWCAAEKDDLIKFTNEQKDLPDSRQGKLEVLVIINNSKEKVLEYVKKEGINFTILLDEGGVTFDKYQAFGTPAHFLINKNKRITDWRPGYTAYDGFLWMLKSLEK